MARIMSTTMHTTKRVINLLERVFSIFFIFSFFHYFNHSIFLSFPPRVSRPIDCFDTVLNAFLGKLSLEVLDMAVDEIE